MPLLVERLVTQFSNFSVSREGNKSFWRRVPTEATCHQGAAWVLREGGGFAVPRAVGKLASTRGNFQNVLMSLGEPFVGFDWRYHKNPSRLPDPGTLIVFSFFSSFDFASPNKPGKGQGVTFPHGSMWTWGPLHCSSSGPEVEANAWSTPDRYELRGRIGTGGAGRNPVRVSGNRSRWACGHAKNRWCFLLVKTKGGWVVLKVCGLLYPAFPPSNSLLDTKGARSFTL